MARAGTGMVSAILLIAGLLKLFGAQNSPLAQYGWLLSSAAQAGIVIGELLLAVWLLLPYGRYFSWLTATLTFTAFGVVSGYLGWIGQASCGCFGPVPVSPWVAFGIDLTALGLLFAAKPKWISWRTETPALGWVAFIAASGLIAALVSVHRFGSVDAGLSYLRGDQLLVVPSVIDFGVGRPGEVLKQTLTLRNVSRVDIRLSGATNDCTCRFGNAVESLAPEETYQQTVLLRIPADAQAGRHCRDAVLYSNSPANPLVVIKLCCRIQK